MNNQTLKEGNKTVKNSEKFSVAAWAIFIVGVFGSALFAIQTVADSDYSFSIRYITVFSWKICFAGILASGVMAIIVGGIGAIVGRLSSILLELNEINMQSKQKSGTNSTPFSVHVSDEALNGNYERKESQEFEPGFDQEYDPEIDIEDDSSL